MNILYEVYDTGRVEINFNRFRGNLEILLEKVESKFWENKKRGSCKVSN